MKLDANTFMPIYNEEEECIYEAYNKLANDLFFNEFGMVIEDTIYQNYSRQEERVASGLYNGGTITVETEKADEVLLKWFYNSIDTTGMVEKKNIKEYKMGNVVAEYVGCFPTEYKEQEEKIKLKISYDYFTT